MDLYPQPTKVQASWSLEKYALTNESWFTKVRFLQVAAYWGGPEAPNNALNWNA